MFDFFLMSCTKLLQAFRLSIAYYFFHMDAEIPISGGTAWEAADGGRFKLSLREAEMLRVQWTLVGREDLLAISMGHVFGWSKAV